MECAHMTTAETAQGLLNGWERGDVMAAACPSRSILRDLTSRWGLLVMLALATGPHRFGELRRRISGISERMLSETLKTLEADGFVLREAHDVVPPHVVYSLTPLGEEAATRLSVLTRWIEDNLPKILSERQTAAE
jgi:DNA-binding HxlR family transcriptional regulator